MARRERVAHPALPPSPPLTTGHTHTEGPALLVVPLGPSNTLRVRLVYPAHHEFVVGSTGQVTVGRDLDYVDMREIKFRAGYVAMSPSHGVGGRFRVARQSPELVFTTDATGYLEVRVCGNPTLLNTTQLPRQPASLRPRRHVPVDYIFVRASQGCTAYVFHHFIGKVRELLVARAAVLSGRWVPMGAANGIVAWLTGSAPLWVVVAVCRMLCV